MFLILGCLGWVVGTVLIVKYDEHFNLDKELSEEEYDKVMKSLVYRDNIPIMIELYNLNLLKVGVSDFSKVPSCILEQYQEVANFIGQRKVLMSHPHFIYSIFKRRLCGDFSANWQQALKEANTLRLENLKH